MWSMSKARGSARRAGEAKQLSKMVRLLLRKRYTKLRPAGDCSPSKISRKSKNAHLSDRTDRTWPIELPHKNQAEKLKRSGSRSVIERLGDVYVDFVWSTATHAKISVIGRPKVPLKRATTFEKMFGEPHDTRVKTIAITKLIASSGPGTIAVLRGI